MNDSQTKTVAEAKEKLSRGEVTQEQHDKVVKDNTPKSSTQSDRPSDSSQNR